MKPVRQHLSTALVWLGLALLMLVALSGCAQMPGQTLAVDATDPCAPQRAAFRDSGGFFSQRIGQDVAVGALGGCVTGGLIGGVTNGARGALIGCGVGAAGGAAIGLSTAYWQNLQQSNADQQTLSQTVNRDLQSETGKVDHVAAAFADLRACRFSVAGRTRSDARRGLVPRVAAQGQLAQQRAWFDEELNVASSYGVSMEKRDDQFAYAAQQLPPPPPAPRPVRRGRTTVPAGPPAPLTVATETLPQKRNSFEQTVATAKQQSVAAFSLDSSATTRAEFPLAA